MTRQAAQKLERRATYVDLEAVPPGKVAELIDGELHVMPRPAPRHANAASVLIIKLGGPFHLGDGGPGGWWILDEPELHFPHPTIAGEIEALVPDIAGWQRERMPELPETAYFSLAPEWICEVISPSTATHDRERKMPIYAREGVLHAWLIDPIARTLEVHTLGDGRRWGAPNVYRDEARVRAAPFDAVELNLTQLWAPAPKGGPHKAK